MNTNDYLSEIRNVLVKSLISNALEEGRGSWRIVPLREIADIQSGYSYKSSELVEASDTGMLSIKNFDRNGSFRPDGFKPIVPLKAKPNQYVQIGDIIVAHTDLTQNADIIGRAVQVIDNGGYDQMVESLDLVKVTSSTNNVSNEFLAALLGTEDFHKHCLAYVNGTTVLHLGKKALPEYALKIPKDEKTMALLDSLFKSITAHQAELIREIRYLGQTRDSLLPRLMSGEIDVSQVELPTQPNNHLSKSFKLFPMKPTHTTIARILVTVVFASNILCVLQFIFTPEQHTAAYQLQGASATVIVQSFGICFLMWNATYPPVIAHPDRYRVLFAVVIAQQVIGLVGESALLASLDPQLATLAGSIVRFIVFDAAGLVLLLIAFVLTRNKQTPGA